MITDKLLRKNLLAIVARRVKPQATPSAYTLSPLRYDAGPALANPPLIELAVHYKLNALKFQIRCFSKCSQARVKRSCILNIRGQEVALAQVKPGWDFLNHDLGENLPQKLTVKLILTEEGRVSSLVSCIHTATLTPQSALSNAGEHGLRARGFPRI